MGCGVPSADRGRSQPNPRRVRPCVHPHSSVGSVTVKFLRTLQFGLLARRTLATLSSLDGRLAEQNLYLRRLADHFAPQIPDGEAPATAGIDFLNPQEAGIVLDYIDRTKNDTGKVPTEDEILRYLADQPQLEQV